MGISQQSEGVSDEKNEQRTDVDSSPIVILESKLAQITKQNEIISNDLKEQANEIGKTKDDMKDIKNLTAMGFIVIVIMVAGMVISYFQQMNIEYKLLREEVFKSKIINEASPSSSKNSSIVIRPILRGQ